MGFSNRFDEAFAHAHHLHRNQIRKGADIPYVSHLMAVCALVVENGGDEDQAIAALLHDAAEDCGGEAALEEIRARFGEGVARIVEDCTDGMTVPKPEWRARKEAYLARLPAKAPRSLLVSAADKVHNAESILWDYRRHGDAVWSRFTAGRDGTIWYYRRLADILGERVPASLGERLAAAVASLPA